MRCTVTETGVANSEALEWICNIYEMGKKDKGTTSRLLYFHPSQATARQKTNVICLKGSDHLRNGIAMNRLRMFTRWDHKLNALHHKVTDTSVICPV